MRSTWTAAILADRLNHLRRYRRDSTTLAFIEPGQSSARLVETICAFANLPHGGTIVFGVSQVHDYRVVGVKNTEALIAHVTEVVRRKVSPSPFLDFTCLEFASTVVLVVEVRGLPASLPVARCAGLAYFRDGSGNYLPSPTELAMLEARKRGETVGNDAAELAFTSVKDLGALAVALFVDSVRATTPELATLADDRQVLTAVKALAPSGALTLAGSYLLGRYPQAMNPQLKIMATTETSQPDGSVRRQRVEFEGSLPEMLEQAVAWVKQHIGYPIVAVKEFIANALIHRDLNAMRPVELVLQEDRLCITNPGGLGELVVDGVLSPREYSHPVNPLSFSLAQQHPSQLVSGRGVGVETALRAVRDAMLVAPSIIDMGVSFTVVLYKASAFTETEVAWLEAYAGKHQLSTVEQWVFIGLRRGQKWNISKLLTEYPGYTYRQITQLVDRLTSAQLLAVDTRGDFQLVRKHLPKSEIGNHERKEDWR